MDVGQIINAANFNDGDQHRATRGLCGTFAIALFKHVPGGRLVLVTRSENGSPELMNDGTFAWHHCAVRYGDRYFDVLGETNADDMIENFVLPYRTVGHVVEVDEKEFWRNLRVVPGAYSGYWRTRWTQKLLRAVPQKAAA